MMGQWLLKNYHFVLTTWLQTINVSTISQSKAVLIFDGCPLHLNIDILKNPGGDGMVDLSLTKKTSQKTNVEYLVTFGIAKTEFKNSKQSLMTEHNLLSKTDGLKRE